MTERTGGSWRSRTPSALADALADDRLAELIAAGRETALANDKHAQEPLWRSFFDGFVAHA